MKELLQFLKRFSQKFSPAKTFLASFHAQSLSVTAEHSGSAGIARTFSTRIDDSWIRSQYLRFMKFISNKKFTLTS